MTIKEAMKERHMVRKYIDRPIPSDLLEKLNTRIAKNNQTHNLSLSLVAGNGDGLGALAKMIAGGSRTILFWLVRILQILMKSWATVAQI